MTTDQAGTTAPHTTAAGRGGRLDADQIRRRLRTHTVGRELHVFDVVDSTSATLRRMAQAGAADGTVVIADEQLAGHGRAGRTWFSPPGANLYLSVLLRPAIPPRAVPVLAFIAPLAVVDVLQDERVTAGVKWPNDVLVERRKVAGTLAEAAARDGALESVVLGIGVNLNVSRAALRAALGDAGAAADSLGQVLGRPIDRNAFAAALLNALDRWLLVYERRGPATIVAAWQDRDVITGHDVEVRGEGAPYGGRAVGLDADGRLVVVDASGAAHHVVAGEIRFLASR